MRNRQIDKAIQTN